MDETRPALKSRPKLFLNDGGYRTVLPESTLDRFGHHISPLTGIVDGIRRVHEDSFLQVYMSAYSFPPRLKDRSFLEKGLRARSTGKGIHSSQARASALSEALERYSGVFRGDEPVHRATYAALGDAAVHPNDCMLFSQAQYEQREAWNQRERDFNWVPEPFRADTEIDWTPVWSLTGDRLRFVPTAYCYYGYPVPTDHDLCRADSNGNAAGNTLEEAILQGFMEVVERDSVALWWYNHGRRPAVDLDSFSQPYFGALRDYYRSLGRELWVLDLTHDFGIPSVASVSISEAEVHLDDLLLGFGAHFDPAIAICRALTEMNQFLPSAMAGRTLRVAEGDLGDVAFLSPDPRKGTRGRDDFSVVWNDDLLEDVLACVRIADERGLEVLVLDQTRAEVGMPVVKVIVPGMYPFWARFAPGRLYNVPSELGWVEGMTPEPELNGAHIKI
jgi:ribosomal protein S12 methylthiotransferase accessory factor